MQSSVNIENFRDLCELGAKIVKDEVDVRFNPKYDSSNLDVESFSIKHFLYEINKNGILTRASQPGLDMFPELENPDDHDVNYNYQRAFVLGYIEKPNALKLYDKIKDNQKYFIFLSEDDLSYIPEIHTINEISTNINFLTTELNEYLLNVKITDRKDLNETIQSLYEIINSLMDYKSLQNRLITPKFKHMTQFEKFLRPEQIEKFNEELICICIMDKVFNRKGTDMWNFIINLLKEN